MLDYTTVTRQGPWMLTASGRRFWPLDPHPDDVTLEDIGWALSQTCRYGGQVPPPFFYSVAEHSCLLARHFQSKMLSLNNVLGGYNQDDMTKHNATCLVNARYAFVHDFPEAYIGDVIRPIKPLIPDFAIFEKKLEEMILTKYGLDPELPSEVNLADKTIVNDERMQLWPLEIMRRDGVYDRPRLNIQLKCLNPIEAYREFMLTANELGFII